MPALNASRAELLDAFGFARKPAFVWFVLAITALMVLLEAKYNIDLLNALSNPNAESAVASDLSQRGKLLAAFGITWAVARGLLTSIRPFAAGLAAFLTLSFAAYHGLDYTYSKVLAGLDPEVKVMGFNLFSYRRDLLKGTLEDPDIPLPQREPVIGKIFMGAFPMVILDDRFMLPAQDIVERKANDKQAEVLALAKDKWLTYSNSMRKLNQAYADFVTAAKAANGQAGLDKEWNDYSAQMDKLAKAHESFISASRKAKGETDLSQEWASYQQNMRAIDDAYQQYIEGSRKALRYGNMGINRFREQSQGLDPNPNLSRAQFLAMLKRSNHPKAQAIRQAENREIGRNPDGSIIYAREIPYFLSRGEFGNWVQNRARQSLKSAGLEPDTTMDRAQFIERLRQSGTPAGNDLKEREQREIGLDEKGKSVRVKDMPYFMGRTDFDIWSTNLARNTLKAKGLEPDPDMPKERFLSLLRQSKSAEGERLREAERQEIAKRPDGTPVLTGEVPYFLNYEQYMRWVGEEAQRTREMAMPTKDNVEQFARIQEVNSAIFLPPMAIISSLTSALTNGISLVLMLTGLALTTIPVGAAPGRLIQRLAMPLMLAIFASLLYVMPSHVFPDESPIHELETQFHERVGVAGVVWSKLSNIQKHIL